MRTVQPRSEMRVADAHAHYAHSALPVNMVPLTFSHYFRDQQTPGKPRQ